MARLGVRRSLLAFGAAAGFLLTAVPFTSDATPPEGIRGSARATAPADRLNPPARQLTVAATGDILPHSPLWTQAVSNAGGAGYDFAPMFADQVWRRIPKHAADPISNTRSPDVRLKMKEILRIN